jgi:hypothetical protein
MTDNAPESFQNVAFPCATGAIYSLRCIFEAFLRTLPNLHGRGFIEESDLNRVVTEDVDRRIRGHAPSRAVNSP